MPGSQEQLASKCCYQQKWGASAGGQCSIRTVCAQAGLLDPAPASFSISPAHCCCPAVVRSPPHGSDHLRINAALIEVFDRGNRLGASGPLQLEGRCQRAGGAANACVANVAAPGVPTSMPANPCRMCRSACPVGIRPTESACKENAPRMMGGKLIRVLGYHLRKQCFQGAWLSPAIALPVAE